MDTRNVCGKVGIAGMLLVGCWLASSATVVGSVLEEYEFVWGGAGTVCVSADYDGDSLIDPALYQPDSGEWRVLLSSQGYADTGVFLGGSGFEPLLGDFDGDGKNDPSVYREASGEWFCRSSTSGYEPIVTAILGGPGYNPVPADYDGDGTTEMAVYQPVTAHWVFWLHADPEVTDTNVLAVMYSNAMVNASNVVASKIKMDLTSITADNTNLIWRTNPTTGVREVLVASYMNAYAASNYYHVGQNSTLTNVGAEAWITLVPELKNFCRTYGGTNLYLRLKQLLGLPATSRNTMVVEYYVDPQYLLRPARDPEITDREAEISFRTNTPYAAMVSTNYSIWFQNTIDTRNYGMTNGVWGGWPWTQLGYTYDWLKTGNIVGLSEFVVPGKMLYDHYTNTEVLVYVVSITDAANYAAVPNNLVIQPQGSTINVAPWEER